MEYKYSAINKEGKIQEDMLDASSYHDAVTQLHQLGLIPTEIKQKQEDILQQFLNKLSSVSLQDKILFIQNLSIMLKAGISLTKALRILSTQTNNPKFKAILGQVFQDIESGKAFADSLAKYPETFANIFVSMVRVGELSGNLDKSLEYLGIQLQREHALISKTRGAMIYPAVIVFAVFIVGILLSIFVLPSLVGIFKDSQVALPITTRIVIGFVNFMSNHTIIALGIIALFFGGIIAMIKTSQGKAFFDKMILKMPIFGEIVKKINMARFARIMSSMLRSGTPILEGLQVVADSLGNGEYKKTVKQAAQDIKVGKGLSASLSQSPKLFSYLITQMIGVGEESGTVDAILEEIAVHYEAEVDDVMNNLSSIIEPVLILVIGSAVGVLALALIGPIYSITQQAGG